MIIHCNETYFKTQCELNGWPIDRAMKSVSQVRGDKWYVETNSPFYPGRRFRESVTSGPGTELKKLLKLIGITSSPNCKCNSHARKMDTMEAKQPGWCEENMDTILGWLEEQAKARKLPFVRMAARQVVKLAIKRANKKPRK